MISDFAVTLTPSSGILEGDSVTFTATWADNNGSATDWGVSFVWGDGSDRETYVATDKTISKSHTYANNGTFEAYVQVWNSIDSSANLRIDVQVGGVPPTLPTKVAVLDNSTGVVTLTFTISNVGTDDNVSVSVNWGDGTSSIQSYGTSPTGEKVLSHIYSSYPTGRTSHRRLLAITVSADGSTSYTLYPQTTYTDVCTDDATGYCPVPGSTLPGTTLYFLEQTADAVGTLACTGDGYFYQNIVSSDAEGSVDATGISDYTSVFITQADAECRKIGSIPFEDLVPPQ